MVYTTNITRINYSAASKMIAAAVARADEMNVPQCIAIMDPSGGLVCCVLRNAFFQRRNGLSSGSKWKGGARQFGMGKVIDV